MKFFYFLLVLIFLLCTLIVLKGQQLDGRNIEQRQIDLKYKVDQNKELLNSNPDKAFFQIDKLIKEVQEMGLAKEEINLLTQRVLYYYHHKIDFDKLISSAKELKEKSKNYNDPYGQADANLYLFDAYCLNNLYENALNELQEGQITLKKVKEDTDDLYQARSKFYIAYANYYSTIGDTQQEIESLLASVRQRQKISQLKKRQASQIRDFSNLANAYSRIEKFDSAKLYAEASLRLMREGKYKNEKTKFINYSAIGDYYFSAKNYTEALNYFKKAEKHSQQIHYLNIARLYYKIAETYDCIGNDDFRREYEYKLKDISLKVAETKNESLHKFIEETKQNDKSKIYIFIIAGSILIIASLLTLTIRYQQRNRILKRQDNLSQEYLLQQPEPDEQSYKDLVEMVKQGNLAFMGEFQKAFPHFVMKLQPLNDSLVQSELEFCALLKLKLSTKEIAKYKNIMPRTVQNKKYRIRKKFNIPDNTDIYIWFEQL